MVTPIVRIPRCYGHPDNTDTQLLRTVFSVISVTGRVRLAGHEFNFEFLWGKTIPDYLPLKQSVFLDWKIESS